MRPLYTLCTTASTSFVPHFRHFFNLTMFMSSDAPTIQTSFATFFLTSNESCDKLWAASHLTPSCKLMKALLTRMKAVRCCFHWPLVRILLSGVNSVHTASDSEINDQIRSALRFLLSRSDQSLFASPHVPYIISGHRWWKHCPVG